LQVTAAAGSSVVGAVPSITSHVQTLGQDFTCSTSNNQLSAGGVGQSLTLISVPIVAAASSKPAATTKSTKSTGTTAESTAVPTPAQVVPSQPEAAAETPPQFNLVLSLLDATGHPLIGAQAIVDSKPPVTTNSSGLAEVNGLATGDHNLTVIWHGQTSVKSFNLAKPEGQVFKYQLAATKKRDSRFLYIGGAGGFLILLVGCGSLLLARRQANKKY
jgi:hypothetical protein